MNHNVIIEYVIIAFLIKKRNVVSVRLFYLYWIGFLMSFMLNNFECPNSFNSKYLFTYCKLSVTNSP